MLSFELVGTFFGAPWPKYIKQIFEGVTHLNTILVKVGLNFIEFFWNSAKLIMCNFHQWS